MKASVDEVVAGLSRVDAEILARFAGGEQLDVIAAGTGQRRKEVDRVVQQVAQFNAAYARTLALGWQRANSPGRIGSAAPSGSSASARLREVEAELARVDAAAGRDIAKPDEPLVDRVADLLRGRAEATERTLELAEELSRANGRIREQACEIEQLTARIQQPGVPGDVLFAGDARHCAACRWTGREPHDDHPTVPVRVTVTRRST